MRIQSPDDEKYFKDVTLNHILEEISNENENHQTESLYIHKKDKHQRKIYIQVIFFGILPILLLLFFFVPIKQAKEVIAKPTNTAPVQTTIVQKKNKEEIPNKVENLASDTSTTIKIIPETTNPQAESVRNRAKDDLLKQMKI